MFGVIRKAIAGKKTYILGVIAVGTALVAWATGGLTDTEAIVAVFAAMQSMFIRAGVKKVEN